MANVVYVLDDDNTAAAINELTTAMPGRSAADFFNWVAKHNATSSASRHPSVTIREALVRLEGVCVEKLPNDTRYVALNIRRLSFGLLVGDIKAKMIRAYLAGPD